MIVKIINFFNELCPSEKVELIVIHGSFGHIEGVGTVRMVDVKWVSIDPETINPETKVEFVDVQECPVAGVWRLLV